MTEPSEQLPSQANESEDTSDPYPALRRVLDQISARPDALRDIIDEAVGAFIAFDSSRIILRANAGAELLLLHERHSLDGKSTDMLLPARLRQPDAPPMTPMADLMQIELAALRGDGQELPVEWALGSVLIGQRHVFVMRLRDRTMIDRAIEALRASEERFRLLVEGVHDYAIFMLDQSGLVSSWNKGAERSKGWREDEILGASYEIFFTPEDRAAGLPKQILATTAREGTHEVVGWRVRKDGTHFRASAHLTALHSATGELRGFAKITRDLTDKVIAEDLEQRLAVERAAREAAEEAEHRVRASEERLRRLQRVAASLSKAATPLEVGAVVLDQSIQALGATAGAIYLLSANGRELELLDQRGHPAQPMREFEKISIDALSPLSDAVREKRPAFYEDFEDCASHYPHLREAIRSGGFEASSALPLMTSRAVLGVLGIRFKEKRANDERDQSLQLTLTDLCAQALDRARLLAAERTARAEAEAASRSKDEFLAMLGHELRNPLAPIVTALTLMNIQDDDATRKERTIIRRQVTHLVRLVDDLLDVSRITRGKVQLKKESIETGAVVARAIELASDLLEQRHQHLTLLVPDEGFLLFADPTRLAQVVANLLTNAAKYTQMGGHIEVAVSRKDGRINLSVKDDGIGISAAMLPRIFGLFEQETQSIERSQGGLGLGLAIAKNLVALHDGTVSAFSEGTGKGSTFIVDLPAAAERVDHPSVSMPAAAIKRTAGGRRVLVVDDNMDAAELLVMALQSRGHVAEIAADGPEALEIARAFQPEIALLDIGLPVMDGYELARRLRAQLGDVHLIAVTGYGQASDIARAKEAGFDAHLVKPVELDALSTALANVPSRAEAH